MLKLLLVYILCAIILSTCEQQKQASTQVGAIPKSVVDKTNNDLNNALLLEAEKRKVLENLETQFVNDNK